MYRALLLTVVIMLILPSCRSREDADPPDSAADNATLASADTATRRADTATARADTATSGADTGMVPATAIGKMVSQMMASMEAHMRVMDTARAATMQARMPRSSSDGGQHDFAHERGGAQNEHRHRFHLARYGGFGTTRPESLASDDRH